MKFLLKAILLVSAAAIFSNIISSGLTPVGVKPSKVSNVTETPEQKASRILQKVDDLWRGKSSHGVISMTVKTEHYERSMRMEAWSKGKNQSLVIIRDPLKERGTATLKSDTSIYSYLPKTDRTIRLTAGMMMSSWMGSHFTNDDLVKESRLSEDYIAEISFEGKKNDVSVLEFTLLPKPDAAVVWGKITMTVREADLIPLTSTYFDEEMQIARTMTFAEAMVMGGRLFPTVLKVTPEDKPGEYTKLIYEKMEFDLELQESFFSIAQLKRK